VSRGNCNSTVLSSTARFFIANNDPDTDVHIPEELQTLPLSATGIEEIDVDRCCMCFASWHDDVIKGGGAKWVFCQCSRWLHEHCVEDVAVDKDGNQCFCSFCINKYTV